MTLPATILAFSLGAPEIILLVVVILFFFGAKRIPDLARGLGKSISEFKKGKDEGKEEESKPKEQN
jgi:sec-independent protein translocase protein TatA